MTDDEVTELEATGPEVIVVVGGVVSGGPVVTEIFTAKPSRSKLAVPGGLEGAGRRHHQPVPAGAADVDGVAHRVVLEASDRDRASPSPGSWSRTRASRCCFRIE